MKEEINGFSKHLFFDNDFINCFFLFTIRLLSNKMKYIYIIVNIITNQFYLLEKQFTFWSYTQSKRLPLPLRPAFEVVNWHCRQFLRHYLFYVFHCSHMVTTEIGIGFLEWVFKRIHIKNVIEACWITVWSFLIKYFFSQRIPENKETAFFNLTRLELRNTPNASVQRKDAP